MVFAVDKNGNCHGISKLFGGSFKLDEIDNGLKLAIEASKVILPKIHSFFSDNNTVFAKDSLHPDVPPFRLGFLA